MMTKGITDGKLPEDVYSAGKSVVKERFLTVAGFYAVTGVIKGIFSQIGRGITAIGQAVGGDTGGTVGSTISSVIQTIVSYLCDCCLGWVFYRKNEKATKATLEGAVLFFKHGKTLLKNLGRVFGISLISFVFIGGVTMWAILHSVFVRPFILVGVLRNFIESGKDETFSEKDFDELDKKSKKFKELHAEAA